MIKKKQTKHQLNLFWKIILIILGGLFLAAFILFIFFRGKNMYEKILCEAKGGYFISPETSLLPSGCFKIFSDAGKVCSGPSDCEANACIVEYRGKRITDVTTGQCPRIDSIHVEGKYYPWCGEATIDNGKIVNDRTQCVY